MHSRRAHPATTMPLVEGDGEEDVCGLRSAVRDHGVIRRAFKIRIVKIDIRDAVTCRRKADEPSTCADKGSNPVDQDKVAQVIRPELRLKAVRRFPKRGRHYAGVSDNYVERFSFPQQVI